MTKKWHKGPPPSLGWWPASYVRDEQMLRWWDGHAWSCAAFECFTAKQAAREALKNSPYQDRIKWTARLESWPERSKT